ncbi:MAG: methyltransferase domain-containing protein [Phormidesmis sp.]
MTWNAANYQENFSYVWQGGESLLAMLNPQPHERILDLGCGTGQLTAQIAMSEASVIGLDYDAAMIEQARANYLNVAPNVTPNVTFDVADAANFQLPTPVDAVFSNAALHWVTDVDAAARCIAGALKPGGRFVAELGGKGNVRTIIAALETVSGRDNLNPWYFPSVADYAAVLEAVGLEVSFAHLFNRPTPLGDAGLSGWLQMFSQQFFADLSVQEWADMVKEVEAVASELRQGDGWTADYRRLRVVARRPDAG